MSSTTLQSKHDILAEIWMNYRNDEDFKDFIEYNDLGLPIAYMVTMSIVKSTELSDKFVSETFDILLGGLDIEDTGFETLDEVMKAAEK